MLIIDMCHQREPLSLHVITSLPLTQQFIGRLRDVRLTHVHIHLISRLEFRLAEHKKLKIIIRS